MLLSVCSRMIQIDKSLEVSIPSSILILLLL